MIPLDTHKDVDNQKQDMTSIGKSVEKLEHTYFASEDVKWCVC